MVGRPENIRPPSVSVLAILHVLRFRPKYAIVRSHGYCHVTDKLAITSQKKNCTRTACVSLVGEEGAF
jgi:hypothetical protein